MNKKYKSIIKLIIFLVLSLMLFNVNVYATEIKKGDYSKEYLEWLKLADEDKANTIPPLPFNIRSNEQSTSLIDKIRRTLKSISIPSRYDLREHIDVEVKNQEDTGECWAFTANSSIETYLALNNKTYNFSERHIDYDTAQNYVDGVNENALKRNVGAGGYSSTAFTYYSRGSGPILEEDMPFINDETPINLYELPKNSIVQKVDNMIYFPSIFKSWGENNKLVYTDGNGVEYSDSEIKEIRNKIKKHIMQYGAVSTAISAPMSNFNNYYCSSNVTDENTWADHAVTIIGWDDSFSKNNFDQKPSTDGAYIVLNSWGTEWGEQGIYYISYEDLLVETNIRGVTSVSDVEYDNLYQHDISEVWNIIETKYAANVFKCTENEKLTEVMVGCFSEEKCNIYISNSTELNISNSTLIAENISLNPGYNTIKINETINLQKGNNFTIIVELINDDFEGIGIEDNNEVYYGNATSNLGESFMSSDGYTWSDIYDKSNMMNFSIKAYTQTNEEKIEVTNILGKAYEEFGGDYSFSIKTSYREKDREVALKFYDENSNELNDFIITGNKIKGNGAFIEFECPEDLEAGTYYVDISLSNFDSITKSFNVSEIDDDKVLLQFNDENFLQYMYTKTKDSFVSYDSLQLIASQESINNVTKLEDAYMKKIKDITGIQYYKNINEINFNSNEITNIEQLKNLTKLKKLYLDNNKINDFSSISDLIEIEALTIAGCCRLENIDFLNKLNNLTVLDMKLCGSDERINIEKIFSLEGLKQLDMSAWYWIDENDLKDMYKLENLKFLALNGCNIGNIGFLKNLNLETLEIGNVQYWMPDGTLSEKGTNHFTDLTPISEMYSLIQLNINDLEGVENLDSIENLTNLSCLWFQRGTLRDAAILDSELLRNKRWDNLLLTENRIDDIIEKTDNDIAEINVPVIINQACDSESLLYSPNGVLLNNCEWIEYGKSIKFDTANYDSCSINILSGYANGSIYSVQVNKENENDGTLSLFLPDKLRYKLGEELDLSGAGISYAEGDSVYWISLPDRDVTVTGYDKNKSGVQIITVTYKDKYATFEVTVEANDETLNLTPPDKLTYQLGQELDLSGGGISYSDDNMVAWISLTDNEVMITGYDKDKLGIQTITVTYKGKSATFDVTVVEEEVPENCKISISTEPRKTVYIKGETLDLKGGTIAVEEKDIGYNMQMTDSRLTIEGFDSDKIGEQTITISYKGQKVMFKVIVKNDVVSISISNLPKTTYIKGEDFDLTNGKILVTYEDGSTEEKLMTDDGVGYGLYAKDQLGTQTITVEYKGKSAQYEVIVKNDVVSISISNLPKTTYIKGEDFDLTNGKILVTYEDGSTEEKLMTDDGVGYGLYAKDQLGTQTITVEYKEKSVQYTITVIEQFDVDFAEYEIKEENQVFYIQNIFVNTTVKEIKENIKTNGIIEVYKDLEKIEDENTKLATGMKLSITHNDTERTYQIVVLGDVSGDGEVDQLDLLMLARYKAGFEKELEKVKGAYLLATDIVRNNNVAEDVDLLKLARILVELDNF